MTSSLLTLADCEARLVADGYAVTAAGDVWSYRTGKWVKLRPALSDGYRRLTIKRDGRFGTVKVARLVCDAFHGPKPFPAAVVRHLDGSKIHDHQDNLAWGTYGENALDAVRHGTSPSAANARKGALKRRGAASHCAKLDWHQVREIRLLRSQGAKLRDLSSRFLVSEAAVSRICLGQTWIEPSMIVTGGMRADG